MPLITPMIRDLVLGGGSEPSSSSSEEGRENSACGPNMTNVKISLGGDKDSTPWTTIQGVRGLSAVKLCRNETGALEVVENILTLGITAAARRDYIIYFRSSLPGGYYYFRDESGDVYSCGCGSGSKGYVAFSSARPAIVQIWHSVQ